MEVGKLLETIEKRVNMQSINPLNVVFSLSPLSFFRESIPLDKASPKIGGIFAHVRIVLSVTPQKIHF